MKLSLFFTFDVSARLWKETGLLDREKLIYERFLESGKVNKIYWLTYGTDDKNIEKELKDGIEIIPMPRIFRSMIGKFIYSVLMPFIQGRYIKDTDILKTNQMNGSWTAIIASWLYKKPVIVRTGYTWSLFASRNSTSLLDRFASLIEKVSHRNADISVVATSQDAYYISNRYGINTDCVRVIPNYVDTDSFSVTNSARYKDRIIFVGRLTEQKNLKGLIHAIKDLPYRLDIYGSGELKKDLRQLANNLNVRVSFLENIPNSEMPRILNRYYAFILPSFYEGMPKALLEAMACGCAVIGTNVDGVREIISHDINGILCDTTSESIRHAIEKVMSDEDLRERLGRTARDFVVEHYSLRNIAEDELSLYRQICNV